MTGLAEAEGSEGASAMLSRLDLRAFEPLILAYCPASTRPHWAALFALHRTLRGHTMRHGDPVLAQLRLAWWRDALEGLPQRLAAPDPVLQQASCWGQDAPALAALVDGYEAVLAGGEIAALLDASAEVCEALGRMHGGADNEARRLGEGWGLAIASSLGPEVAAQAQALAKDYDWADARLPRALLPLRQLNRLARARFASKHSAWRAGLGIIALALAPSGRTSAKEGER